MAEKATVRPHPLHILQPTGSDSEPVLTFGSPAVLRSTLGSLPDFETGPIIVSNQKTHLVNEEPERHGLSCLEGVPLGHPGLQQRDALSREKMKKRRKNKSSTGHK